MNIINSFLVLNALLLCSQSDAQPSLFGMFSRNKKDVLIDNAPNVTLSNNQVIPLVGLGVGNLQADVVESMAYEAMKSENQVHLFDTAHVSNHEKELAHGITSGAKDFQVTQKTNSAVQVHVVTKVWYTHLGYERTKISVRESMKALNEAVKDNNVDLKVHFLIQWPRCYSGVEWMNCQEEEDELPEAVKQAGPSPLLNKAGAWKDSWKALEDMYRSGEFPAMAGIGVSNFGGEEMDQLIKMARVKPHIVQMNVWSLLNDPHLVDVCNKYDIHIQVFNVMNGILGDVASTPHAYNNLVLVGNQLSKLHQDESLSISAAQVVLKWLIQHGISPLPRTANLKRLHDNSPMSLKDIPDLSEDQSEIVAHAVEAMIIGKDLEEDAHVHVTFTAKNQDTFLYYYPGPDDTTEKQITYIGKGESFEESTHPNHTFRIYNAYNPDVYRDYKVPGSYGDHIQVDVEV